MKSLFHKLIARGRSVRDKMDEYQETLTFAEAGEPADEATVADSQQAQEQPGLLLVIGKGESFSRRIIDYALEMAQRMSYEILALNIAPVPRETFAFIGPSNGKIKEFEDRSRENVQAFRQTAEQHGISFRHTVKSGETDAVINELGKEYGTIEFVVSEPEAARVSERPEKENRPEKQLHVYSMV
ncbi:MAG: universal stress protein [Thermodesulfobacteriota bacterium]|nr:universal stress protein [Thermodesulfobacteriota bacterium]